MLPLPMKAAIEAERLRLWRQALKAHPRMTPATAEILERGIEKKLMIFAKNARLPAPAKRPRQTSFEFLREFPAVARPKKEKNARRPRA